ncbi:ThiF family adenylyltransferase [Candidatus Latescibacterota bacterium]
MGPRYARQQAVEGWDQERLQQAAIAVAGTGPTAFLCSLMATAMGFGRIVLLGVDSRETKDARREEGDPLRAPRSWPEALRRINPEVRVYACHLPLTESLAGKLPALDGVIVAGNGLPARKAGYRLAQEAGMPVVAGGAAGACGIWGVPRVDRLALRLHGREETPLLSQVIAALLVEELRKALMPLTGEAGRSRGVNLVALAAGTGARRRQVALPAQRPRLALVGAGALGTWFGLALGWSGLPAEMEIFDDDVIDETNLNRQVLFHDAVGQPKAPVLAARLQKLFPRLQVSGYGMRADEESAADLCEAPVLVGCPDNFEARALLNRLARTHRRVLLSGGTSATGGSCSLYEPGCTSCLSCRMRIDELARSEQGPQSCGQVHEASVVTSNAITGALMALSYRHLLRQWSLAGTWEYDGTVRNRRIGLRSVRPGCRCHLLRA